MEKFKQQYKENIIANIVSATKDDFYLNLRLAILSTKTTKVSFSEEIMKRLINKMWVQFIRDCTNPKIGITEAINKVFKQYH